MKNISLVLFLPNFVFCMEFNYFGNINSRFFSSHLVEKSFLNPDNLIDLKKHDWAFCFNLYNSITLSKILKGHLKSRIFKEKDENTKFYLDEGYLNFSLTDWLLTSFGKINPQEGYGLAYKPLDLLRRQRDFFDFETEREGEVGYEVGVLAKRLEFKIRGISQEEFLNLIKLSLLFDSLDTALYFFSQKNNGFGLSFSGCIKNVGFYSDCVYWNDREKVYLFENYQKISRKKDFLNAVFGVHYTTQNRISFYLEYFHNGEGYSNKEWDDFVKVLKDRYDKINLLIANSILKGRKYCRQDYLFLYINWEDLEGKINLGFYCLRNLNDKSFFTNYEVKIKSYDNFELKLNYLKFYGDKTSEYGLFYKDRIFIENSWYF